MCVHCLDLYSHVLSTHKVQLLVGNSTLYFGRLMLVEFLFVSMSISADMHQNTS
jgi:hypothetical protein